MPSKKDRPFNCPPFFMFTEESELDILRRGLDPPCVDQILKEVQRAIKEERPERKYYAKSGLHSKLRINFDRFEWHEEILRARKALCLAYDNSPRDRWVYKPGPNFKLELGKAIDYVGNHYADSR